MSDECIRVLHMIGNLDCGGSQTVMLNLFQAIDRNKVMFDFIIDHPKERWLEEKVIQLGGKVYEMPTFRGWNLKEVKKAWNRFFEEHQEYKILHTHVRSYASIFLPIAKRHGLITIAHSHNTSNGHGPLALVKDLLQLPLRYQADYLFACSKEAGQWLFGKNILTKPNFRILKNAIDAKKFVYNENVREKVRAEYQLTDAFVIGHIGRFTQQKNHAFLFHVFADIKREKDNAKLLLVGDGELRKDMESLARDLNIWEDVLFLGQQSEVDKFYQAMDIFVFPSLWEGLAIAIVEAQAAGLHCVLSNQVPTEADIHENMLHYLPPSNKEAWVKQTLSLVGIPRRNTYDVVVQAEYDIRENASRMMDFYVNLHQAKSE